MSSLKSAQRARLTGAAAAAALLVAILPVSAGASVRQPQAAEGTLAPALTESSVVLSTIESGLNRPVFVTGARDGTTRLFIVEQGGRILVRKNGAVLPTPLLDISTSVATGSEQGLLGLALVVGLLAAALNFVIGQRLGRPLQGLTRAAARIGFGDLAMPVPTAPGGEIATLAATLEEMRWRLQALTVNLRRQ